jgi:hypothetical protein
LVPLLVLGGGSALSVGGCTCTSDEPYLGASGGEVALGWRAVTGDVAVRRVTAEGVSGEVLWAIEADPPVSPSLVVVGGEVEGFDTVQEAGPELVASPGGYIVEVVTTDPAIEPYRLPLSVDRRAELLEAGSDAEVTDSDGCGGIDTGALLRGLLVLVGVLVAFGVVVLVGVVPLLLVARALLGRSSR